MISCAMMIATDEAKIADKYKIIKDLEEATLKGKNPAIYSKFTEQKSGGVIEKVVGWHIRC